MKPNQIICFATLYLKISATISPRINISGEGHVPPSIKIFLPRLMYLLVNIALQIIMLMYSMLKKTRYLYPVDSLEL